MPFDNPGNVPLSDHANALVGEIESHGSAVRVTLERVAPAKMWTKKPGLVDPTPKRWRTAPGGDYPRQVAVLIRDDNGSTRDDVIIHELAHACHILEYAYTPCDLAFEAEVEELSDIVFHPWVYWKQRQVGVQKALLAEYYGKLARFTIGDHDDLARWLKYALSFLEREAVLERIGSFGLEPEDTKLAREMVEAVAPGYEGDLHWDQALAGLMAIDRLRKLLSLPNPVTVDPGRRCQ